MSKCFNGFDGFDCRDNIWWGIFHANAHGGSKRLREILSISDDWMDPSVFARKLKGDNAWANEADTFLSYSERPADYQQKWLSQWTSPAGCLELFRRFIASVPSTVSCMEQERFLPPARELCAYLECILVHCGQNSEGSQNWIAAGMYALTAFFLQNGKAVIPRFYCPPAECDPVISDKSTIVVPNVIMGPSESEQSSIDFFEQVSHRFHELFGKQKMSSSSKPDAEATTPEITLPATRMQKQSYSSDFTIQNPAGYYTRCFQIERFLIRRDNQWYSGCKMQSLSYTENGNEQTFRIESEYLQYEPTCNGLILTVTSDGRGLLNTFVSEMDTDRFFISKAATAVASIEIDDQGRFRDIELEQLFEFCGIDNTSSAPQPTKKRKFTSKFNPDYLQFLVLDPNTLEVIIPTFSRDPATGEYQLNIILPCPRKLFILQVHDEASESETDYLALLGYLHGVHGLRKDLNAAKRLAKEKAESGDLQMIFEYGVMLKQEDEKKSIAAECYLRRAADKFAGAQFELADLLKNMGTQSSTAEETDSNQYLWHEAWRQRRLSEAEQLIDDLWGRGYRTYDGKTIDLFGKHDQT